MLIDKLHQAENYVTISKQKIHISPYMGTVSDQNDMSPGMINLLIRESDSPIYFAGFRRLNGGKHADIFNNLFMCKRCYNCLLIFSHD